MTDLIVPLMSKRRERALLLQKVQHVFAAVVLLMDGAVALSSGASGPLLALALAEIGSSALVIAAFARAVRASRTPHAHAPDHAHAVDWVDVFLSAMLATEVFAHWHESGHVRRPTVVLAILMLALGLSHGRLAAFHTRRRALRLSDRGLTLGGKFFTRFSAAWSDIARIDLEPARARIVTRDRRTRTIDLADLQNPAAVRDALRAGQAILAKGSPVS